MTILFAILLFISLTINGILVWYITKLMNQLYTFTDEVSNLETYFESFGSHLEGIYELEMFYGDQTLDGLILHSKDLLEKVSQFKESFSIEQTNEEEDGEEEA